MKSLLMNNLCKIIKLQQEEIKLLRGKNSLLSQKIEQLFEIITNKGKIPIDKSNKNTFNIYVKDLPVSDQQYESSILFSNNYPFEEILENEEKPNLQEFKLNLNLNEFTGIKDLDNLKLERKENSKKLLSFKQNNTQINFKKFDFIELRGLLTNINKQLNDFKIICESTTESKINNYLY